LYLSAYSCYYLSNPYYISNPAREDTYQDVMPLYDNIPSSTPKHPLSMLITHNIPLSPAQATEIEALFPQSSTTTAMP
jgi:hypothetical protein